MSAASLMFINHEELKLLTDYTRPAEQIKWLRDHNYRFAIGASGRPKVLLEEIRRHMIGGTKSAGHTPRLEQLN